MNLYMAPDGHPRCGWAGSAPEFLDYHDNEWGYPVTDDIRLFEKISLEGFQSGLSWRTILAKRDNFREAFAGFDFHIVANCGQSEVDQLLGNPGIVRHRGKIEAVINNAGKAVELQAETGSLASFFWRYEPEPGEIETPQSASTSPSSIALSRELKRRGWKFVGPTTIFAFMQAMGLINDHADGYIIRAEAAAKRGAFKPVR